MCMGGGWEEGTSLQEAERDRLVKLELNLSEVFVLFLEGFSALQGLFICV